LNKIIVSLKEADYPIYVGENIFVKIPDLINKFKLNKNILVVVDKKVNEFHNRKIHSALKKINVKKNFYLLNTGENIKSYKELNKIYSFLLRNNYGRDSLVISIGGGVTGDLAGYAAATYMRGIQLIHVPTTLLASVDSSIGGKTGINFEKKKNMIGSFYQPEFVLVDTNFLATLPEEEITSGIGEVIKYAFLSDLNFFDFISNKLENILRLEDKTLVKTIIGSDKIKAAVVSQDEKEAGLRKILNLGHTFAHSFETELKFSIKHGEAVIAGLICALILSNKLGFLSDDDLRNYLLLPLRVSLPSKLYGLNKDNLYNIMLHDKKNRNGRIKFVLLAEIGKLLLDVEANKKEFFYTIREMEKLIFPNKYD